MYKYFISYSFFSDDDNREFDNIEVELKAPITSIEQIKDIESKIYEAFKCRGIVILNYILLKKFGE